jgi:hypothetical protein
VILSFSWLELLAIGDKDKREDIGVGIIYLINPAAGDSGSPEGFTELKALM